MRRRARGYAVAGLAVAAAISGLVLAGSAQAATPTMTLSAPSSVLNNGTVSPTDVSIAVNNAGGVAISGDTLSLTIGGVTGLACANIHLTAVPAAPALTTSNAFAPCTFSATGYSQAADTVATLNYTLGVLGAPLTGTLSSQATLSASAVTVASSNAANTTLAPATTPPPPTTPTLTTTAPASITNNGSTAGTVSVKIDNSGRLAIPGAGGTDKFSLTISGVAGLACANITLTGTPALTTTDTFTPCTYKSATAYTQATDSVVTKTYTLSVNAPHNGTLSLVANLTETATPNGNQVTVYSVNSNTATTVLGTALAPAFSTSTIPPAIVYHAYSFQLGANGTPAVTAAGLHAFWYAKATSGFTCGTNAAAVDTTGAVTGTPNDVYVALDNGFIYDVTSGKVLHPAALGATDWKPARTWVIVANNQVGGAATTAAASCPAFGTSTPTPAVALHDVLSRPSTLTVLFSDVAPTAPFANEIYTLAQQGAINGFADGTYRPSLAVSRQEFAAILGRRLGTADGACSGIGADSSRFSDVPNGSPFCEEILTLSRDGVINGYSNGTFHPADNITRGAIAALFYRAYNFVHHQPKGDALCTTPIPFNDVTASNPFCGDIEWMASNHYANGYLDGGYHPRAATTRDADAAFMFRVFPTAP